MNDPLHFSDLNELDRNPNFVLPFQERDISASEAAHSLLDFTCYTKPDYFINWHHKYLAKKLEDFVAGKIKRLIVQMPPRSGKSELVSRRLPAYIFGKDPDASLIACSYASDLAQRMNRDVQRIMDTPDYHKVFPETKLWSKNVRTIADNSALRNSDIFEIVNHTGSYRCAGVGGGITGMGGKYLILDDFIKNAEEAESETYRKKLWEWFSTTFHSRLEKDGGILVTATRWHEDDLIGRLLKLQAKDPEADQYEVVSFPMIREEEDDNPHDPREIGEVLWPEKYTKKAVKKIKATLGSKNFNALHQQRPSSAKGNIVKRSDFKLYQNLPQVFDSRGTSWDFTFKDEKKSDYVVGQVWGKLGSKFYLIDQVRDRMNFKSALTAMLTMVRKHPYCDFHLVEEKANGSAIINVLETKIPGIVAINPKDSKYSRAVSVSPKIEAGNVFLPEDATWVQEYIEEWASFPRGAHDDQCFVAGTKIATKRGDVNIEDIKKGDLILTPYGYRRCLWAGETGTKKVIQKEGLIGTKNHPIFTWNKGFVDLDSISQDNYSFLKLEEILKWGYLRQLSSMGLVTEGLVTVDTISANLNQMPEGKILKDFTLRFGNFIRERKFLEATLFITRMVTISITVMTILSVYHVRNMLKNIVNLGALKNASNILKTLGISLKNGIVLKKVANGIENMLNEFTKNVSQEQLIVCYANQSLKQNIIQESFARKSVDQDFSTKTTLLPTKKNALNARETSLQNLSDKNIAPLSVPVFNLEVEQQHCYYANGILVHNCDATSQILEYYSDGKWDWLTGSDDDEDYSDKGISPQVANLFGWEIEQ